MKKKKYFKRICTNCGKEFKPTGAKEKLCLECWYKTHNPRKYWKNKKSSP